MLTQGRAAAACVTALRRSVPSISGVFVSAPSVRVFAAAEGCLPSPFASPPPASAPLSVSAAPAATVPPDDAESQGRGWDDGIVEAAAAAAHDHDHDHEHEHEHEHDFHDPRVAVLDAALDHVPSAG